MQAREDELKKQNFDVPEGLRVNMQNLTNPTQLKEFDQALSQQLGEEGFAIVPARHAQLFQVYEENDYREFPHFVTSICNSIIFTSTACCASWRCISSSIPS